MSLRALRDRLAGTAGTAPVPAPVPTPDPAEPKQGAASEPLGPLGPLGPQEMGNAEANETTDGDPALEFYAALFQGQAARALVSLEPADVRRALALGLLTAELAEESVLLAYRREGVAGALIALPSERYDGLAILQSFTEEPPA